MNGTEDKPDTQLRPGAQGRKHARDTDEPDDLPEPKRQEGIDGWAIRVEGEKAGPAVTGMTGEVANEDMFDDEISESELLELANSIEGKTAKPATATVDLTGEAASDDMFDDGISESELLKLANSVEDKTATPATATVDLTGEVASDDMFDDEISESELLELANSIEGKTAKPATATVDLTGEAASDDMFDDGISESELLELANSVEDKTAKPATATVDLTGEAASDDMFDDGISESELLELANSIGDKTAKPAMATQDLTGHSPAESDGKQPARGADQEFNDLFENLSDRELTAQPLAKSPAQNAREPSYNSEQASLDAPPVELAVPERERLLPSPLPNPPAPRVVRHVGNVILIGHPDPYGEIEMAKPLPLPRKKPASVSPGKKKGPLHREIRWHSFGDDYLIAGEPDEKGRVEFHTREEYRELHPDTTPATLEARPIIFKSLHGDGCLLPPQLFAKSCNDRFDPNRFDKVMEKFDLSKQLFNDLHQIGRIVNSGGPNRTRVFSVKTPYGYTLQSDVHLHPVQSGTYSPDFIHRWQDDKNKTHFTGLYAMKEGIKTPEEAAERYGAKNLYCKTLNNAYVEFERYDTLVGREGDGPSPLQNAFSCYQFKGPRPREIEERDDRRQDHSRQGSVSR